MDRPHHADPFSHGPRAESGGAVPSSWATSFDPGRLTIDQLRELRDVWINVAEAGDPAVAGGLLTARIAAIIHAPVGLIVRDLNSGSIEVEISAGGEPLGAATVADLEAELRPHRDDSSAVVVCAGESGHRHPWTCLPVGTRTLRSRLLLLPGDWSRWPSDDWLDRLSRDLSTALRLPADRGRGRRRTGLLTQTRAFGRRAAAAGNERDLHQTIVDAYARATHADQASLALMDEDDGQLWIAATHGYPRVLIEHVRISPGSGVIGQVFSRRRPLMVADIGRATDLHARRPRYRSASFLSLPLVLRDEVLGVVSMTDRRDTRPFDRSDLVAALSLAAPAALAVDRQRLQRRTAGLAHAVAIEPLTGLFNRRHFSVRIDEEVQRARRYSLDLALLIVDIDNFKQLNDSRGHLAGDQVLRDTASILRQSVRVFDVCTRYGGDEFAILMPGSTAQSAMQCADRIRQRVEAYRPAAPWLAQADHITISVGVSARKPAASSEEMIAAADRALYAAKNQGKNRVSLVE